MYLTKLISLISFLWRAPRLYFLQELLQMLHWESISLVPCYRFRCMAVRRMDSWGGFIGKVLLTRPNL